MNGWSVGSGPSSVTAEAAYTAPAGRQAVLKGILATPQTGTSAVLVEYHAGDSSNAMSTAVVGYSTGQVLRAVSEDGLARGKYILADATSNLATSFVNVFIWGSLE